MKSSVASTDWLPPRERILVAAHALFYAEGIRATGIDRIIERASVSKVTFYRQFPGKDALIRAYLDYRHARWMSWFQTTLGAAVSRGTPAADALAATLRGWFRQPDFRGCAFLNAAAELGSTAPEILEVVRQHKRDMASLLDQLLDGGARRVGRKLSLLIDGAIVHAQMGQSIPEVMKNFKASVEDILNR